MIEENLKHSLLPQFNTIAYKNKLHRVFFLLGFRECNAFYLSLIPLN